MYLSLMWDHSSLSKNTSILVLKGVCLHYLHVYKCAIHLIYVDMHINMQLIAYHVLVKTLGCEDLDLHPSIKGRIMLYIGT